MIKEVLEAVDFGFDYWIKKNLDYGVGEEFFNERVWKWCLKVWDIYCKDKRYKLEFILFRVDQGKGFYRHRDKGSGKEVLVIVLSGCIKLWVEGETFEISEGNIFRFEGNRLHGLEKGGNGKYLVLFSGKLK